MKTYITNPTIEGFYLTNDLADEINSEIYLKGREDQIIVSGEKHFH